MRLISSLVLAPVDAAGIPGMSQVMESEALQPDRRAGRLPHPGD